MRGGRLWPCNAGFLLGGFAALMLAACTKPADSGGEPAAVPADFALSSARISLPQEEESRLPQTAAGDLLAQNCTGCHSAEMLLSQPPFDPAKWQATIDKMRQVFHAPIDPARDAALVRALAKLQKSPGR